MLFVGITNIYIKLDIIPCDAIHSRGGSVEDCSPRMREIEVLFPVATDLTRTVLLGVIPIPPTRGRGDSIN